MKIIYIPPREVPGVYKDITTFIQSALDTGREETTIEIIYQEMLKDLKQLFIIATHDYKILGACVTEITQYPFHRSLKILMLGGSRLDDWYKDLDATVLDFARKNYCKYVEVIGRKGWVRQLKPLGYNLSYYYLHKEV